MLARLLADALFVRGTGHLQAGRARRALSHLALAARLASSNAGYFGAAALAAHKAGNVDAAVRYCERALELDPGPRTTCSRACSCMASCTRACWRASTST